MQHAELAGTLGSGVAYSSFAAARCGGPMGLIGEEELEVSYACTCACLPQGDHMQTLAYSTRMCTHAYVGEISWR